MKILIVAATVEELEPIQLKLAEQKPLHDIFKLVTDVGMIATTFQLTKVLKEEQFDLAINVGIAGSFDRSIALGEVVEVVQDQFSEEMVEDGIELKSYEDVGLRGKNERPFINGVLHLSLIHISEPTRPY